MERNDSKTKERKLMFGIGLGFINGNTFSPFSVSGLHSYYTADVCTNSGGTVTVIPDQSANHEASLTVVSGQPLYTAADTQFNNRPSFGCVSAARRVEVTFNTPITQPATYYQVIKVVSNPGTVYWRSNQGNFTDSAGFYVQSDLSVHLQCSDGGQAITSPGTITPGTYVSCTIYDSAGASSALYLNNSVTPFTSEPSDGDVDANSNLVMTIGTFVGDSNTYYWTAAAQYNGAHSAATRSKLMKFFGTKYGITTT